MKSDLILFRPTSVEPSGVIAFSLSDSALARACCEATLLADGAAQRPGPGPRRWRFRASYPNPIGGPLPLGIGDRRPGRRDPDRDEPAYKPISCLQGSSAWAMNPARMPRIATRRRSLRRSDGRRNRKSRPRAALRYDREAIRQRPTLPGSCPPSTIGAEGLNDSVRNGKRCFPLAMATEIVRGRAALDEPPGPGGA
jgi:hypothetical protein